jgi:dienelactone hydrolase
MGAMLGVMAHLTTPTAGGGQAPSRQWGGLAAGPHAVGFRLAGEYDRSRRVAPTTDFEGRPNAGPRAMSMQVAIWYPATRARAVRPMQYGELAAISAKRTDLATPTAADRVAAIESMRSFSGFAFGRQLPESLYRIVDTTLTAAFRDAPPVARPFPALLVATDGSLASATVLFEYLASHGIVVMATPSRSSYGTIQVSRPAAVVEARVRDLEYLLDRASRLPNVDTTRIAVLGVNFDGMAALAFQMKNMAARAVVSLDGWEGKRNSIATMQANLHFDPRRLRVPYLVIEQDEETPSPALTLDRTIFDSFRYSDRQWLVLTAMSHAYLIGNPLVHPSVPPEKRQAYELLARGVHRFLDAALAEPPRRLVSLVTAEGSTDGRSPLVKDILRADARPAVPDDAELERLIMVDKAVDKVATILRGARQSDSTFVLFPQGTMALYAFRFSRMNDLPFAVRLMELNAEAFPRSWSAADALANGYRDSGDSTRAIAAYTRAIALLAATAADSAAVARTRQSIEAKLAQLRR